jgi:formylglycine-generating enzyme required for sulfatase activity
MFVKKILLLLNGSILSIACFGQAEFKNVQVTSSEGRVIVDYDLLPTEEGVKLKCIRFKVVFKGQTIVPETLSGAIGNNVSFGNNQHFVWHCGSDSRLFNDDVKILLEADCEISTSAYEPETVFVKGGTFRMGSNDGNPDEKPIHEVTVDSFRMGKYEVTYGEFKKFIAETAFQTDAESAGTSICNIKEREIEKSGVHWRHDEKGMPRTEDHYPVLHVSWNDAVAYCNWLGTKLGKKCRLATEAEWEYAARGGQLYQYAGSDSLNTVGWYWENGAKKPLPVGGKKENGFGLYDMSGNVWEWCSDWYSNNYDSNTGGTVINPTGPKKGEFHVFRGGSWLNDLKYCNVSERTRKKPNFRSNYVGFRVVFP